ncbi:MAG: hypothetical protein ACFFC7_26855 [Candidatus Hermodarchaeota archaeon]
MRKEDVLDYCFYIEIIKHFLRNYDLKVSGRKRVLVSRLLDHPDFDIDDIPDMLNHYQLQEVCDVLDIPRTESKTVLWDRIMEDRRL